MFDPGTLIQHTIIKEIIIFYICDSINIEIFLCNQYAISIGDYVIIKHNWKALNARTSGHVV